MAAKLQFDFVVDKENSTLTVKRNLPVHGNWCGIAIRRAPCSTAGSRPSR
jgi:hypothetical protein